MLRTEPADRCRGTGTISAAFGLLFFVGFLLFAAQLLIGLYRSSLVGAAAYDAAHAAADAPGHGAFECGQEAAARAEQRARQLLGDSIEVTTQCEGPSIVIEISVDRPQIVSGVGPDELTRVARVRIEGRR